MADLGNGGRLNSMKQDKENELDELLQNLSLVDFVSGCLQFSREGGRVPFTGPKLPKNHLSDSYLSGHIEITMHVFS